MIRKDNKIENDIPLIPATKPRWIHTGGGSFRLANGKIVKPKEKFNANIEQIPPAFRDVVKPLGWELEKKEVNVKEIPGNKPKFTVVEREKKGFFNVIDEKGKVLNTKALRKLDAETLVTALES
jgi:hypothetical protein